MISIKAPRYEAVSVGLAQSFLQRALGLIVCPEPARGTALWFHRCRSVHTFFMSYPIDVIYLDDQLRVVKTIEALKPWRMSWCPSADSVLELRSGSATSYGLRPGAALQLCQPLVT